MIIRGILALKGSGDGVEGCLIIRVVLAMGVRGSIGSSVIGRCPGLISGVHMQGKGDGSRT